MNSKEECCFCRAEIGEMNKLTLTQVKLNICTSFCSLLNLPHYPYGEEMFRHYWCPSCHYNIKSSGDLIKKLEQISAQIAKNRNDLEHLIITTQMNLSKLETQNSSAHFRQSIITKLNLSSFDGASSFPTIEEELPIEGVDQRGFLIPSASNIKLEILQNNEGENDFSFPNDQALVNTDFHYENLTNLILPTNVNFESEGPRKSRRKREQRDPDDDDPDSYLSMTEDEDGNFLSNRKNKKRSRKDIFQVLSPFEIEDLKLKAKNSIVQVSLRRLESMSQYEIQELINSPTRNPPQLTINNSYYNDRIICFNPKFETIHANGRVSYMCLVPGCGRILTNGNCRYDHKFLHLPEKLPCSLCSLEFPCPRRLRQHLRQGVHKLNSFDLYNKLVAEFMNRMEQLATFWPSVQIPDPPTEPEVSPQEVEETQEELQAETPNFVAFGSESIKYENIIVDEDTTHYKCLVPGCGQIMKNKFKKAYHKYYHFSEKISCPICSKTFVHASRFKRHLNEVHKDQKTNETYETQLADFLARMKNSPIVSFTPNVRVRTKISTKKQKTVTCETCGKVVNSGSIGRHRNRHTLPLACEICGKRFATNYSLIDHQRRMHEMTEEEKRESLNMAKVKEQMICSICGVMTHGKYGLKSHMRCHADPEFACQVEGCGKTFTRESSFSKHKIMHSGVRPYICPNCGKDFSNSHYYRVHVRTHSQVKKYTCEICRHSFNVREYLYVHYRKHREKDEKKGILNSPAIQLLKEFSKEKTRDFPKTINKGLNKFDEDGNLI